MKLIPLTKIYFTKVDDEDYESLSKFNWYPYPSNGHIRVGRTSNTGTGKRTVYMSRQITGAPTGMCVDHINGNTLDNRKSNLRVCTYSENSKNRKMQKNNTSGYKGVHAYKANGYNSLKKWVAQIRSERKCKIIGRFCTAKEAAIAYNKAAIKLHGRFAKLNAIPNKT